MLPFNLLSLDSASPRSLLLLGAHCDDIEIGCGGTILQWLAQQPQTRITWVVFSSTPQREQEARASASRFLAQSRGTTEVIVHRFRDGFFPFEGARIKEVFESIKNTVEPDLIFTHYRDDRHQDHRTISDLTWNTWRRHLILEYEIPKYDGDLGAPNCFMPLARETCERKARTICEQFQSERNKGWMTEDTFLALARLRGIECAAPSGFAEAFHCRKLVLGVGDG
jgi:LmbE family N-acetylglucosaminyl deacetylase